MEFTVFQSLNKVVCSLFAMLIHIAGAQEG